MKRHQETLSPKAKQETRPRRYSVSALFFWSMVSCILLTMACNPTKKGTVLSAKKAKPELVFNEMVKNQVNAEWMNARLKMRYADGNQSARATSTIKMKKDSFIWMNVKFLGIEVGRSLITSDSIFVLLRLQKQYIAESLDYVEEAYNIPANLNIIQSLILGNPVFFQKEGFELDIAELSYHLFGRTDQRESHYWLNNADLSLTKMTFEDFRSSQKVSMTLENYAQATETQKFSYFRNLEMFSEQTGKISVDIDFTKLELNIPTDFKFEIPERYERLDDDD